MRDLVRKHSRSYKNKASKNTKSLNRKTKTGVAIERIVSMFTIMALLVFSVLPVVNVARADHDPFGGVPQTSVLFCHKLGNGSYNEPNASVTATGGQVSIPQGHANNQHSGDIIPPFHFDGGSYPGQNWSAETEDIWNSGGCNGDGVVEPDPILGCMDVAALNYNSSATQDNGSCIYNGTLTVTKNTTDGNGIFGFSYTSGEDDNFTITTTSGTGTKVLTLAPGTYSVTEISTPNSNWSENANTCVNVVVASAGTAFCAINNVYNEPEPDKGSLKVTKVTIGEADGTFGFSYTEGNDDNFNITTVEGGGEFTISNLTPGDYSVSEISTPGDNWSLTSNTCAEVVVTANQVATCIITNTFTPDQDPDPVRYTLVLTKTGDGNGHVMGKVEDESEEEFCGLEECRETDEVDEFTETYEEGTEVTLTAHPDENSNFNGSWSGACTGTNPVCVIVMDSDKNVNAHFGLNQVNPNPTPPPPPSGGGGGGSGFPAPPTPTPTPPGQVLGSSTEVTPPPAPQVLSLPRTGMNPAWFALLMAIALVPALVTRKIELVKSAEKAK